MKLKEYKAAERGYANYDWLQANYSFSFANYYNPGKENFGALRVLNDDVIQGGKGFGEHPHNNMEIITIPLQGALKHKDSMSEKWIALEAGEVQVMSAGKGVVHAEMNNSATDFLNLFQIWIITNKMGAEPAYDQMKFEVAHRANNLQTLVTSYDNSEKGSLKIHQDAKISRIDLSEGKEFTYNLISEKHGVYTMLISGDLNIEDKKLNRRDAIGISETSEFTINAKQNSEVLFIEIPMKF